MNIAKKERLEYAKLHQIGDQIQKTIDWSDPADSLSVFAHIARSQTHEAIIEEKRKRVDKEPKKNEDIPSTSKRQTRASVKREEPAKPVPEIVMEEVPKEKKKSHRSD